MTNILRQKNKDNPFVSINTTAFFNNSISLAARGLYGVLQTLLEHTDTITASFVADLLEQPEEYIESLLEELHQAEVL